MSNFKRVAAMNAAFGNPKGDPKAIDFDRVRKQCLNIIDELGELMLALGANPYGLGQAVNHLKDVAGKGKNKDVDLDDVRDALCDIHVFAYGAHHFMGIDADKDMDAVVDGVMTRFVKDAKDLAHTLDMHSAKGVKEFYIEGEFPTVVVKSAEDQPDAPKGKFLKSASYKNTVFPPV